MSVCVPTVRMHGEDPPGRPAPPLVIIPYKQSLTPTHTDPHTRLLGERVMHTLGYTGDILGRSASPGVPVGPEETMDFRDSWFIAWAITVGNGTTQKRAGIWETGGV